MNASFSCTAGLFFDLSLATLDRDPPAGAGAGALALVGGHRVAVAPVGAQDTSHEDVRGNRAGPLRDPGGDIPVVLAPRGVLELAPRRRQRGVKQRLAQHQV
eukprot:CAMPEP_0198684604 /NCGR_PEP_ID=MMETSP1468-20131203/12420_1 /TAXON_ID=1461545 /ORGANISM="Mantoniella sp, Strain CCMP1436" /LENGTH=101 /DNA_ID=CAMNT_0044429523 /DNA_START=173 /DNA_END=478 /DNA_ORIENTATION=-